MRKNKTLALVLVLCAGLMASSCIGSFGLFNRTVKWNQNIGNKFANELVFLALNIVPVYEVCYLADILVINSIEFWSGNNPMADVGRIQKVKGENGNFYVKTLANGYNITKDRRFSEHCFVDNSYARICGWIKQYLFCKTQKQNLIINQK